LTLGVLLELSKVRLSAMVLVSALAGYVLAGGMSAAAGWWSPIATLVGTGLAALGANALNEWAEERWDALMLRTARRPLPTHRLTPGQARTFGLCMSVAGPLLLLLAVGWLPAALAVLAELIYLLLYTPLKRVTPANTLVGGLVGALPPMIGWAAATGSLGLGAWLLGALLFCWQIPHFLALAWMYRDDYVRGGFCMLPAADVRGDLACGCALLYTLALLPISLLPTAVKLAGTSYAVGAATLGLALIGAGVGLHRSRRDRDARRLFHTSIIYLPLVLTLLMLDRLPPGVTP
jgi:protoheme IX farnesyltransferase